MRHLLVLLSLLAMGAGSAGAQISVIGSGVEEHQLQPGGIYSGTIRVRNTGSAPTDARVYLTDYTFTADGETSYGEPGTSARSNATWIRFSPAQVRVAPGGEATIGYTVTVPAGQGGGSYWSMVMVEGVEERVSVDPRRHARVQLGVGVAVRYGVQIATTIPGASAQASFVYPRAVADSGGRRIEVDLTNPGLLAYRPKMRLELYDASGNAAGVFTAERGLLYPGTGLRQVFEIGEVPAGTYQALVTADTGGEEVFGAQYRVRL